MQGDQEFARPSICVVAVGGVTPDLSDQTLQDYQVLRVSTEAEALARSGADAFLWLTSGGKLASQALEECVWALQSADWATWEDTGAAPAPSMRDVAGPLGVSRKALGWPEPKPGGTVRRLPSRCIVGPAERHAEESIPAQGIVQVFDAGSRGHWLSRIAAHVQNSGLASAEAWRKDPIGTALMVFPERWKQGVNRRVGRAMFDLSGYTRFDSNAAYANGMLVRPLRYSVVQKRTRKRIAILVGSLGETEAQRELLLLVEQIDRAEAEIIIVAERSTAKRWKRRWMECADHLFEADVIAGPQQAERMMYSLARNWDIDALIVADSPAAYVAMTALRGRLAALKAADIVADMDAEVPETTIDSLDYRIAISQSAKVRLEALALGQQQVRHIPYGVELAEPAAGGKGHAVAIAFRGRLDGDHGAHVLPALAAQFEQLSPDTRASWIIAGEGPLESRLRHAFRNRDTAFLGDAEPDADVLVVPSEGVDGDWAALQALRRGTLVVGFVSDSRQEVIADGCGMLVVGGHDGELRLANALAELLQDPSRVQAMKAAGRQHVSRMFSTVEANMRRRAFLHEFLDQAGGKIQSLVP